MREFNGFLDDAARMVPVPSQFFSELLAQIDDLNEMRIILFCLGFVGQSGDYANCILTQDFINDSRFMSSLGNNPKEANANLQDGLERAVQRGSLLHIAGANAPSQQTYYFINTPRGRSSAQALQRGELTPSNTTPVMDISKEKPNLFALYEANIGALTPMIAETLRDAEKKYPAEWVEEAMKIAVENNIRRWRYVEAILKSWKEEGRHGGDKQNPQEDYRRYVKGKFGQFGKR
jgi:DNA replication protein